MSVKELVKELPKGMLKWYDFRSEEAALYMTARTPLDTALSESLTECGLAVDCLTAERVVALSDRQYKYVVASSILSKNISVKNVFVAELLHKAYENLADDGILLLITDNRLGVRYFCGDRDPFTERNFDGIENYKRIKAVDAAFTGGRLYAKAEIADFLQQAGFLKQKFYAVFPEISSPQILLADGYVPQEELSIRIFPQYHNPSTVFLEEENLYTSLAQNGMLHSMANGFLVECPKKGNFAPVKQVTISMDRGRKNALCTIIRADDKVIKKSAYNEGKGKLVELMDNNHYLLARGIPMVEAALENGKYVMPYVQGEPMVAYFRKLVKTDRKKFYRQFDRLMGLVLRSSDHVPYEEVDWEHFDPRWDEEKDEKRRRNIDRGVWKKIAYEKKEQRDGIGVILQRGYIDLVLINGLVQGDDFIFYDQELYIKNLPVKAVMLRNIAFLYHCDEGMEQCIPMKDLLERYGIMECNSIYYAYISYFLTHLRNDDILSEYHKEHRRDNGMVHSNRQRMNYSTDEYLRMFVQLFANTDNKKLYLFGSGRFAQKFLAMYGDFYHVDGLLDNKEENWGSDVDGIEIMSPDVLRGQDASTYKVIICIKNYVGVLKQLKGIGATNISVYDTGMEYPLPRRQVVTAETQKEKKKYHIGYVAGVFDLFHIGHLNLLRRAKEQCDYLIVGVVSDEGVTRFKKVENIIPFEERLAIVQACQYVDEAVKIPLLYGDTQDAYRRFKFDAQFSGSDYENDPIWLAKRDFLRAHGSDLVFFPYTETTSSSMLREKIGKGKAAQTSHPKNTVETVRTTSSWCQ